jgi:hypothetical protein
VLFAGSRYERAGTHLLMREDGSTVIATRLPLPLSTPVIGYHRRVAGQRLDLIAMRYLGDATTFWRLCDANEAVVPDALAARELVGIPQEGRV